MASSRTYVPSRALLRALSRPLPPRCPFARPIAAQFIRAKRTKAAKVENASIRPKAPSMDEITRTASKIQADIEDMDDSMRPLPDKELESDDLPIINWYEQDLDKGTPRRLVERIATAEDRKKDKEMFLMIEESQKNPEYDDAQLNRRLIDSLVSNPNFADLTQELKDIKEGIKTKEELNALDEKAAKGAEQEIKQFNASLRMAAHQALQDLIDDPDIGDAQLELQEVQANMPEIDDIDNPDFQAMLEKAMAKLDGNEAFQTKMKAMADESIDLEFEKEWEAFEKNVDETLDENESDDADLDMKTPEDLQDVDKLLHQMRDVLKSMGGDSDLEAELDAVLSEDPEAETEGDLEREMDPEELAEELKKLAQSKAPQVSETEAEEEDVPAELQAKVDKIMEDPKLMEKLMYIQKLIAESEQQNADLTTIAHETAPDPYELEESRTATLKERMDKVRQTPEHIAALRRLRVNLPSPFNISPALKSFNQAIELAYIGANDDIRRILWRAYQKARALPTFLQNVSDEAWDILYYSQAVTWGSNQNRQNHLRIMLADLKSLGREGPPTHPSTLVKRGEGEHLDV
ncbi:Nn.00g097090.m01.CDS01 [Neocucurbitaria sp. VM-36]